MSSIGAWKVSLLSGIVFGMVGFFCAFLIMRVRVSQIPPGEGWQYMKYCAAMAAFIVGTLLWRMWVAPQDTASGGRGLWVGALVGLLSHPVAWYLLILFHFFSGESSSLGEKPLDPIQAIWGSLVFSFWSVFLVGFFVTIPLGAVIGFFLARR